VLPTKRPGIVISEMGRRVMDLQDKGWSVLKIAQHCGCDKNSIQQLVYDPRSDPRYVTGNLLIELHASVMEGETQWSKMIRVLVVRHGMTFSQIAQHCKVTTNYLRYGFIYNQKKMPRHRLGNALAKLYYAKEGHRPARRVEENDLVRDEVE